MGVVTVSRQFGAGGLRVAPALAEGLGYRLVDREIVQQAALRLGLDPDVARGRDERAPAIVEEVGMALAAGTPEFGLGLPQPDDRALAEAVAQVIRSLAAAGSYVVLGRGGQAILGARPDAFHLSLVSPREDRIRRVAEWNGLGERAARERCERADTERPAWVRRFFGADVADPLLYDCVLNTSSLGVDGAAAIALEAARRKLSV